MPIEINFGRKAQACTAFKIFGKGWLQEHLVNLIAIFSPGNGPYLVDPSHVGSDGRGVAPDGAAPFAGQLFFKPQPGSLGSLQRRILSGPTYWNYNFAVIKETKLFENHLIQFRADFYNIFNHPNFFAGDQTITSSSFGKITSTLTSGENVNRRTIQFGLTYKF